MSADLRNEFSRLLYVRGLALKAIRIWETSSCWKPAGVTPKLPRYCTSSSDLLLAKLWCYGTQSLLKLLKLSYNRYLWLAYKWGNREQHIFKDIEAPHIVGMNYVGLKVFFLSFY